MDNAGFAEGYEFYTTCSLSGKALIRLVVHAGYLDQGNDFR